MYRYVTVLRALNDGKPPNDNIEKGDEIVKAGKHESDQVRYLSEDRELAVIRFEQTQVLDAGAAKYSKSEIMDWAEVELFEEDDEVSIDELAGAIRDTDAHPDLARYAEKADERGGTPILSSLRFHYQQGGLDRFYELGTAIESSLYEGGARAALQHGNLDKTNTAICEEIVGEGDD